MKSYLRKLTEEEQKFWDTYQTEMHSLVQLQESLQPMALRVHELQGLFWEKVKDTTPCGENEILTVTNGELYRREMTPAEKYYYGK